MRKPTSPVLLAAALLVMFVAFFLLWPTVSDFLSQDDCLDAGGVWRNGACEGRRTGE